MSLSVQSGSSTTQSRPVQQSRPQSAPASSAAGAPQERVSLSSESGSSGSVPNFEMAYGRAPGKGASAKKTKETPLRDLPRQMPRTETLAQCKARRAKMLQQTEKFVDDMNTKWDRKYPTGIMSKGS